MNIILPIHPVHVENIFSGLKTIEVRRKIPNQLQEGSLVLIYSTAPIKRVTGKFTVTRIVKRDVERLWKTVKSDVCVSQAAFDKYFSGKPEGYGIFFSTVHQFSKPLSLSALGIKRPPQSFQYVGDINASLP